MISLGYSTISVASAGFCFLAFGFVALSARFSCSEKTLVFFEYRAISGSILKFKVNSRCIMSFINRSYFAAPSTSWLCSRLKCVTTMSGLSSMKTLDQRCMMSGSEKNLLRVALLFSLNTSTSRMRLIEIIKSGRDLRIVQGKRIVSILQMLG